MFSALIGDLVGQALGATLLVLIKSRLSVQAMQRLLWSGGGGTETYPLTTMRPARIRFFFRLFLFFLFEPLSLHFSFTFGIH